MKAYTIYKYFVCQITGDVLAQVSHDGEAYDKILPSVEFAKNYLAKAKKDWFLISLETFINHKKLIMTNSQVDPEKRKALQICIEAYNAY